MPLPVPQLDDRRFQELVTTLRDQIPSYTQEWTDFNPSDPGITLLELWCWLAEMVLYRINQIPQRNYTNFLKLMLDPPEPVTTDVILTLFPQIGEQPIRIPPGIRFATQFLSPPQLPAGGDPLLESGQVIFETYQPIDIPVISYGSPPFFSPSETFSPPGPQRIRVPVRSKVLVENEELGISNGEADQVFYLQKGPVLIDDINTGSELGNYNPNPRIRVDGDLWEYVSDFLEATTGSDSTHFMVEQLTGGIRFGNGVKGKIPPASAPIVAEQYQIILGNEVRIDQNMLVELLDAIPGLPISEVIYPIENTPAEGGAYIYSPEEAQSIGLELFKEGFRAITVEDFEDLASTQFNIAQESIWVQADPANRVARAVAVAGKNLEGTPPFLDEPVQISVIILPEPRSPQEVLLQPTQELKDKVFRFLDRRRLITTRLHVVGPRYMLVSLEIEAVREPRTNAQQVKNDIQQRLGQFFHPLTGGKQGTGWPIGRRVYKAELFQLIESVEGIDHVNKVVMNSDPSDKPIELAENQLPLIDIDQLSNSIIIT